MTYRNVRLLWYYGKCISCGAHAVRSIVPHGEVLPCDKCDIGFRLVLGRRALWDDEDGQRCERFQSAAVKQFPAGASSAASEDNDDAVWMAPREGRPETGTLSEDELRWLFGYDDASDDRSI